MPSQEPPSNANSEEVDLPPDDTDGSKMLLSALIDQETVENIFSTECNGIILMQMTSITWFLSMVRDEKGACFTLGTFISKLIIDRSCEPACSTFTSAF